MLQLFSVFWADTRLPVHSVGIICCWRLLSDICSSNTHTHTIIRNIIRLGYFLFSQQVRWWPCKFGLCESFTNITTHTIIVEAIVHSLYSYYCDIWKSILVYNVMSCVLTYYPAICVSFISSYMFRGLNNTAPRSAFDECSYTASSIRQSHICLRFHI